MPKELEELRNGKTWAQQEAPKCDQIKRGNLRKEEPKLEVLKRTNSGGINSQE